MFVQFCIPVKSLIFLLFKFKVPANPFNSDLVIIRSSFLLLFIALFNTALKLESGISTTESFLNPKGVISKMQLTFSWLVRFSPSIMLPVNINDIVYTLKRLLTEKLYLDYDVNWEKRNNYSCEKNAKIFCDIIRNL